MLKIGDIEIPSNLILGPMAGVTDIAFRKICREFGLEMSYTEMISSRGIYNNDRKTMELLSIDSFEHPIGVQIFGSDPYIMSEAVKRIQDTVEYEVIDINMGCPTPKIIKNGDGSALLKDVKKASKIVQDVKKISRKPVTVKIRLGWENSLDCINFSKAIEASGADALIVHGRTRDQFYSGVANWEIVKNVKEQLKIPVIGNGDIFTLQGAIEKMNYSKVDGIMVARGARGNPWLIRDIVDYFKNEKIQKKPDINEIVKVIYKHLDYLIEAKGEKRGLLEIRKHVGWYIRGFKGSAKVRNEVNKSTNMKEFKECLIKFLDNNK